MKYKEFNINYEPKAVKGFDWDWSHEDYDGAPDADDFRCGTSSTLQNAMESIDEWYENNPRS